MDELSFSREADQQLTALQADSALTELYDRVNDVLDLIEDDPTDGQIRKRRYQTPPVWGVPVHGSGRDWTILWSDTEIGPVVEYVGPDLA